MKRILAMVVVCIGLLSLASAGTSRAEEDEETKEMKRLEGVWASTPAKIGRDNVHVLVLQDSKMGWRSFQTKDGEPLVGHDKLYDIRLDPKASPKQITAIAGDGENQEMRRGIYELDGDTMKIAFSSGLNGERPKKIEGGNRQVIILTRDKTAKIPDLSKTDKRGKEISIEPRAKWIGQVRDTAVVKQCPDIPITTRAEYEKVWMALRGAEGMAEVDFAKEFVLVRSSTFATVTEIKLIVMEGEEKTSDFISLEEKAGEKAEGFTYAIGVFRRELVDVVDGRIVAKGHKK